MCTFLRLRQISFNAIVLLPRYPPSDVMTILHSLSIIRLATEAENPAKQRNVWLQFSHKLKWKQLIGSLVNKYKLDLLYYALFPQNICHFANPLMQFVIGCKASSEGSLGSNIMAVLSPLC
jgi:hypothetical protein